MWKSHWGLDGSTIIKVGLLENGTIWKANSKEIRTQIELQIKIDFEVDFGAGLGWIDGRFGVHFGTILGLKIGLKAIGTFIKKMIDGWLQIRLVVTCDIKVGFQPYVLNLVLEVWNVRCKSVQ